MARSIAQPRGRGGLTVIKRCRTALPFKGNKLPSGTVISFDQGLSTAGYGVMETNGDNASIVEHGIIKLPGKSLHVRYDKLIEVVKEFITELKPDMVIYETGSSFGAGKSPESKRGTIIAEFAVAHTCFNLGQDAMMIHNEKLKYAIASKSRLIELKRQGVRNSMRPIKQDVTHEVKRMWKLADDFFYSEDQSDAIALLYAYATDPTVAGLE